MVLPEGFSAQRRAERAAELFMQGYNCCQSVVLAFSDILPLDETSLKCLASGFGGGMARMREICGCMSGMAFIAGFISPADDPSDMAARTANYALVQEFAAAYRAEMGSIICRDILGLRAASRTSVGTVPEGNPTSVHSATADGQVSGVDVPEVVSVGQLMGERIIESPRPSERTAEYYKSRPCAKSCSVAARIVAQYLLDRA